jgi:hypothetical protein
VSRGLRLLAGAGCLLAALVMAGCAAGGPERAGLEPPSRAYTLGPWALQVLDLPQVQLACANFPQIHAVKLGCVSSAARIIYTTEDFWVLMHELKHALEGDWHSLEPERGVRRPPERGQPVGPEHVGLGSRRPSYALGPWTVHVLDPADVARACRDAGQEQAQGVAPSCAGTGAIYTVENFWALVHGAQHALERPPAAEPGRPLPSVRGLTFPARSRYRPRGTNASHTLTDD